MLISFLRTARSQCSYPLPKEEDGNRSAISGRPEGDSRGDRDPDLDRGFSGHDLPCSTVDCSGHGVPATPAIAAADGHRKSPVSRSGAVDHKPYWDLRRLGF
jgi:hypothetical protein